MREAGGLRLAGVYIPAVVGLLLAGHYLPFVRFFWGIILLILTTMTARRGTALTEIVVLLAAGVGLALALDDPGPLSLTLEFGFLGVIAALGFKNGVRPKFILAAMLAASPVMLGTGLALGYYVWGVNPVEFASFTGPGFDTAAGKEALRLITLLLPGNYAASAFATGLVGFFLAQETLRRQGLLDSEGFSFRRLHLPWYAVWGVIGGLVLVLAGDQWHWERWQAVGMNILFLMFFIFVAAGLALFTDYYHRLTWSRPWKLLTLGFAVLYWPVSLASLAVFGLLDSLVNWRERVPRPPQKEE